MTGILPSSDNLDSNNETELTPLAHGAFLSLFIRVKGPGFSSTSPLNAIDLYHTAAISSPMRTKNFVVAHSALHWMRGGTGKAFCYSIA